MPVANKNMKYTSIFFLFSFYLFISCEKSSTEEILWWHYADIVELDASNYDLRIIDTSATGDFVRFSFAEGDIVTHDNWDVAFRGTTLIVNGGEKANDDQPDRTGDAAVYIANGDISEINSVDTSRLLQDNGSGSAILNNIMIDDLGVSGEGWASYDMNNHEIHPIQHRTLVFRTHNDNYAKMQIFYFYDSLNPDTGNGDIGGYYTFNYEYQSEEEINF
ncbi:HmuY family protein [Flavobacteriales bacterium]|nr:HmuY family protein [Flavobacteriales bacterium]